jgi:predicted nucleotidyltransferase component of viral defense system
MDEIKNLNKDELSLIIAEKGFNPELLTKDYYLTVLLYLLKDIKGMHFKGGTALQKTILDYSRLSEDIDFTIDKSLDDVKKEIIKIIDESKIFGGISKDRDVEGFTRLIIPYDAELGKGTILIDLNKRGKLLAKPEKTAIKHFYPNIPLFEISCLSQQEMIAEKVEATIERNKPRDHYDVCQILKKDYPINMGMVKKKCIDSGIEFSIIKMFNNAKKLHKRWNEDMVPLLATDTSFEEIMATLAKHFKLKEEKEILRNKRK